MVRKSLLNEGDFNEIKERIASLKPSSQPKWGRMNAAQMLSHCSKVLKVGTGEIVLPKTNFLIKTVGICSKRGMWLLNNEIPHCMPTFNIVKEENSCDFFDGKVDILKTMERFLQTCEQKKLPKNHPLFGSMRPEDWGFLEYKHINHHLKQFGQ